MICDGCALEVDEEEGYGTFTCGWGGSAIEKIQSYRRYAYCGACSKALRAALGIPEPQGIPDPPLSLCADERLELPHY